MDISTLLADPVALRLAYIQPAPKLITLIVKAVQPSAVLWVMTYRPPVDKVLTPFW